MEVGGGRISWLPIPRFSSLDFDEIQDNYICKNQPVVIENGVTNTKAYQNWNLDYFIDHLGDKFVTVRTGTDTEDYRLGGYGNDQIKLLEYIKELREGTESSKNRYLAVQNLNRIFPEISSDVGIPYFVPNMHRGPFLWIAREGHFEYLHMDPDDNFLCIFTGQKKVRLFSPTMHDLLEVKELGTAGVSLHTHIDLSVEEEDPDQFFEVHPQLKNTTGYETILDPGNVLFLPFGWYHQVTTTKVCISVNYFCGDNKGEFMNRMFNSQCSNVFFHWILNRVEQIRNKQNNLYFRNCDVQYTDEMFKEALQGFFWRRFKEKATDEQYAQLTAIIRKYCDKRDIEQNVDGSLYVRAQKAPNFRALRHHVRSSKK